MQQQLTVFNLNNWNPKDLADYLLANYTVEIPVSAETPDDLKRIGNLLGTLSNSYSFVMSLLMYAKVNIRECRRQGEKVLVDDAIDRKNVLEDFVSILKMQYSAVSRLISARQQAAEEMKMMGESR